MHNTDKVPNCLVFNLPLLELHQVIAGAQQLDCICLEFPAVWSHCFASSSLNKLVCSAELLLRSRSRRYSLKRG
jgi:hypothetical protein